MQADTILDIGKKAPGESVMVEGLVTARIGLPDSKSVFFLQDASGGIGVRVEGDPAQLPKSGDKTTVQGRLVDNGNGGVAIKLSSLNVESTNSRLPRVKLVKGEILKDAEALKPFYGKYVVVTNVTFDATKPSFQPGTAEIMKGVSGESIKILIGDSLKDRVKPTHAINLFGVLCNTQLGGEKDSQYQIIPTRFVPTYSRDVRKMATKHTCITCHLPDKKLVGPAYKEVAAKYKDDPDALPKMIEQMNNGGSGKWGPIPMLPFKDRVKSDEMKQLADWIFEMRWDAILNE